MKALIVDDEQHVIIAVKLLVDWKAYGIDTILETTSSEDVPSLIRTEQPELVISDVQMPNLSGIQLIRLIQEINPATKTIMISGYSKYDYVRGALQQGCVDYILKPISEEQLNQAVFKAVAAYKKEAAQKLIEQSYSSLHSELSKTQAQRLLLLYYSSTHPQQVWEQLCGIMPGFSRIKTCQIGTIYTRHLPLEAFSDSLDISSITNRIHDIVYETGMGIATTRRTNSNIIIFFSGALENIPVLCQKILDHICNDFGIHFHMGLSSYAEFPEGFHASNRQSLENAISYNLLQDQEQIHNHKPIESTDFPFSLIWFENQLFTAMLSGHRSTICSAVQLCMNQLFSNNYLSIYQLNQLRASYTGIRMRWIENFRMNRNNFQSCLTPPESGFRPPFHKDGIFSRELLESSLIADLESIFNFFHTSLGNEGIDDNLFQQINQYISLNYAVKLSLEVIAGQFFISQNYLSRAFKKKFGIGITDYINNIRVEKAKELLENNQIKISSIASQVGYSDEKYFCRVFKRIEGVSPLQYRSSHGE